MKVKITPYAAHYNSKNNLEQWKINLIRELLHSRDFEIYEPLNKNELEFFIVKFCTR